MWSPFYKLGPYLPGGKGPVPPDLLQRGASLRRFTQQQFSNLTSIVGVTVDRALQDLVQRYNALQPQDLSSHWVPNTYVWGYSPRIEYVTEDEYKMQLPWLYARNAENTVRLDTPAANEARLRGTNNPGIPWSEQSKELDQNNQFVWTNALYFDKPVRIVAINVTMLGKMTNVLTVEGDVPNAYLNQFEYGSDAPPFHSNYGPLDDFYVDLSVDNFWYGDRRQSLSTTEVQLKRLNAEQMSFSPILTNYISANDFQPKYPANVHSTGMFSSYKITPIGVSIDARNINVPIPKESVLRLAVMVPQYPLKTLEPRVEYETGWNTTVVAGKYASPWSNQTYSITLHTLEAMV